MAKIVPVIREPNSLKLNSPECKQVMKKYDTRLDQMCSLDIDSGIRPFRMTGVVCTIGPGCDTVETLVEMIAEGMNICRLSLARNTLDYFAKVITNIREAIHISRLPNPVAIAVDLAGQGARTGNFLPEIGIKLFMKKGEMVVLTSDESVKEMCDHSTIYVNSQYFLEQAKADSQIFMEDGLLSFIVKEISEDGSVLVEVITEGEIYNGSHCHMPRVLPAPTCNLTDYDKQCIKFAADQNVDAIFASWVWESYVVKDIRELLGDKGTIMKIIAKIENFAGVKNYNNILEVADGIMVARGDLGIDLPPEKVFIAQKILISRANAAGKPVICAAQMLESMKVHPRPTRAEASDVANAILDGTDCVMLSGETAVGKYPVRAIQVLCAITREAEMAVYHDRLYKELRKATPVPTDSTLTTAIATVEAAMFSNASAIIVITRTGRSAALIARYRPPCLIVAVTKSHHTARSLHFYRGVYPVLHDASSCQEWSDDVDFRIHHALEVCRDRGFVNTGSRCILVTGWTAGSGATNTIRTIVVPPVTAEVQHYVNLESQKHLGIKWQEVEE